MTIQKKASAKWQGPVKEGKGWISTESGVLKEQPYGFNTRFESQPGTNPEELIAAAHASCFSMAYSKTLGDAGLNPKSIETECTISLEKDGDGFTVTKSLLKVKANIPEAGAAKAKEYAEKAKTNCPISKLLTADISMDFEYITH